MMLTIKLETLLNEAESELAAITGGTFVPNTQMRSIARLESLLAESKAKLAAMQNGPQ